MIFEWSWHNSLPIRKFCMLFVICWFIQNQLFWKILSGILSECQTVWILIRLDILFCLIWVKTVCKSYQQTTLVHKELKTLYQQCEVLNKSNNNQSDTNGRQLLNTLLAHEIKQRLSSLKLWFYMQEKMINIGQATMELYLLLRKFVWKERPNQQKVTTILTL